MTEGFSLAGQPPVAFVGIGDAARARAFYEGTLGLRLLSDELPFALVFDLAGVMLRVTPVGEHVAARHTVLGWQVADIEAAVSGLSEAGVVFEQFGFPGQDARGIWSAPGGAKVAWFRDPDGNVLSLSQHIATE